MPAVTIDIRRLTVMLSAAGLLLVFLSAAGLLFRELTGIRFIAGVRYVMLLQVNGEINNFPVWYSSALLLLCALALAAIAMSRPPDRRHLSRSWWLLAGVAAFASADESVRLHERIPFVTKALFGVKIPWVVVGALVAVVVLVLSRAALRELRGTELTGFVAGAAVFIGGAIGVEAGGMVANEFGVPLAIHHGFRHVEEATEMVGATLILRAALLVLAPAGRLSLQVDRVPV